MLGFQALCLEHEEPWLGEEHTPPHWIMAAIDAADHNVTEHPETPAHLGTGEQEEKS